MSTKFTAAWLRRCTERISVFSLLMAATFVHSVAQASETSSIELLSLPIEDLMDVEIFSASKRNEKIKDIPPALSW